MNSSASIWVRSATTSLLPTTRSIDLVLKQVGESGHASQAAMAIYQHATLDPERALAEKIGATYDAWRSNRRT